MRTHCKEGHAVGNDARCRTCDNATRQQRKAKLFADGLTPQERLRRNKARWAHTAMWVRGRRLELPARKDDV